MFLKSWSMRCVFHYHKPGTVIRGQHWLPHCLIWFGIGVDTHMMYIHNISCSWLG
jgi:hypothetical protein